MLSKLGTRNATVANTAGEPPPDFRGLGCVNALRGSLTRFSVLQGLVLSADAACP